MTYDICVQCPDCKKIRNLRNSNKKLKIKKCYSCSVRTKKENYRKIMTNGYVRIRDMSKNKYVYEHRYVWEKHKGEIPKNYVIHHIDHNRQNNDISNLELMSKRKHDIMTLNENAKNNVRNTFKAKNQVDIPKEIIEKYLNEGYSIREISKIYKVSHSCVTRNMRDYNLKKTTGQFAKKKKSKTSLIKKEDLISMLNDKLTRTEIGKRFGVSRTVIYRLIKVFGIEI